MSTKALKNAAIISFLVSMTILLAGGYFAKSKVPPLPGKVTSAGQTLTDRSAILRGQAAYQRYGLMDHGSVWGHGALRGMDFSAHTLHMIGEMVPDAVIILVGAFPLLFFLLKTFPKLRKTGEPPSVKS